MEHIIVGSLLVIIIAASGWLIVFYNKFINQKTAVANSRDMLRYQLRKVTELTMKYFDQFSGDIRPELVYLKMLVYGKGSFIRGTPSEVIKLSQEISECLGRLEPSGPVCSEAEEKPETVQMMQELAGLGVRIAECRNLYNEKIHSCNMFLSKFPNNIAGKILGVQKLPIF